MKDFTNIKLKKINMHIKNIDMFFSIKKSLTITVNDSIFKWQGKQGLNSRHSVLEQFLLS